MVMTLRRPAVSILKSKEGVQCPTLEPVDSLPSWLTTLISITFAAITLYLARAFVAWGGEDICGIIGKLVTLLTSSALGSWVGENCLNIGDPTTIPGAVLTLLALGGGFFLGQRFCTRVDEFRGVDYSTPQMLPQGQYRILSAPSPWFGLALGVVSTIGAVYFLLNAPSFTFLPECVTAKINSLFGQGTGASYIFVVVAAILVFLGVLGTLPIDYPSYTYLPEESPSFMRRVGRYLVMFLPLVDILGCVLLTLLQWITLLRTPGALNRLGTFPMKIVYTAVVSQPVPFCRAAVVNDPDDRALSRTLVNWKSTVRNLRLWFLREPVKSNRNSQFIPSDEQVWSGCTKTVLAYNVKELAPKLLQLDMSVMEEYATNPDVYFQVRLVNLLQDDDVGGEPATTGRAVSITYRDGTEVTPADANKWVIAKLALQATTNQFFPAMQHNWVHFHFPDNGTSMAHNVLPRGMLVHSALQPFVMSNTNTNANGLGGLVTDEDIGETPPGIELTQTINKTSNEYFVESVRHRTLSFYTRTGIAALSQDVLDIARIKFGFPPRFPDADTVPYTRCLRVCYGAFKQFADELLLVLAEQEDGALQLRLLNQWAGETVRRTTQLFTAADVELADVVATYCWQVSVLHSMDHQLYFFWQQKWMCASGTRLPYDDPNALDGFFTADDVRIYQNFMNVAGFYHVGTPDDSLAGVEFPVARLNVAMNQLRHQVNAAMTAFVNEPEHGVKLQCSNTASAVLM